MIEGKHYVDQNMHDFSRKMMTAQSYTTPLLVLSERHAHHQECPQCSPASAAPAQQSGSHCYWRHEHFLVWAYIILYADPDCVSPWCAVSVCPRLNLQASSGGGFHVRR